jgi:uncharacterized protein YbaR (Trm112 family)
MFIELVDVLRCPNAHDETWLVLAARRVDDRDVMEGTLGCPVCEAEFPILDGVAYFDGGSPRPTVPLATDEEHALRLAAQLNLSDPRGYAVLVGAMATHGPLISAMTDVQLLLVDPPAGIAMGRGLSGLTMPPTSATFPLASASARGVVLDSATTPALTRAASNLLRTGGRLVAPVAVERPPGLSELARDDQVWVAERSTAAAHSGVIGLTRRR